MLILSYEGKKCNPGYDNVYSIPTARFSYHGKEGEKKILQMGIEISYLRSIEYNTLYLPKATRGRIVVTSEQWRRIYAGFTERDGRRKPDGVESPTI